MSHAAERPRRPARDWLGRALSLAALVGVGGVWLSIPAPPDPGAVLAQPLGTPVVQEGCPLPPSADPTDIGDVMEVGFSPLMGRLLVAIVHDSGAEPATRGKAVADASAKLLGCIQLAAGAVPAGTAAEQAHYLEMLTDLRDTVTMLQLTGLELDGPSSQHWFDHTRKQCARCHMVYKPAAAPK